MHVFFNQSSSSNQFFNFSFLNNNNSKYKRIFIRIKSYGKRFDWNTNRLLRKWLSFKVIISLIRKTCHIRLAVSIAGRGLIKMAIIAKTYQMWCILPHLLFKVWPPFTTWNMEIILIYWHQDLSHYAGIYFWINAFGQCRFWNDLEIAPLLVRLAPNPCLDTVQHVDLLMTSSNMYQFEMFWTIE